MSRLTATVVGRSDRHISHARDNGDWLSNVQAGQVQAAVFAGEGRDVGVALLLDSARGDGAVLFGA